MDKFYVINKNAMLNEVETQGVVFCQSEAGEKIYYLNDTTLSVVLFCKLVKKVLMTLSVKSLGCMKLVRRNANPT